MQINQPMYESKLASQPNHLAKNIFLLIKPSGVYTFNLSIEHIRDCRVYYEIMVRQLAGLVYQIQTVYIVQDYVNI
jgi:hypothetical protein